MRQITQLAFMYGENYNSFIAPNNLFSAIGSENTYGENIWLTEEILKENGLKTVNIKYGFLVCPTIGRPDIKVPSFSNYDTGTGTVGFYRRCPTAPYPKIRDDRFPNLPMSQMYYLRNVKRPSQKVYMLETVGGQTVFYMCNPGSRKTIADSSYEYLRNWGANPAAVKQDVYNGRHNGTTNMTYLDGHVSSMPSNLMNAEYNKTVTMATDKQNYMFSYYYD